MLYDIILSESSMLFQYDMWLYDYDWCVTPSHIHVTICDSVTVMLH